jgi:hypothetical protein
MKILCELCAFVVKKIAATRAGITIKGLLYLLKYIDNRLILS